MITHNLNWFLCLSVAAHAAVLSAWQMPAYTPGNSGHALQLSITQRAGDSGKQAAPSTEAAARPVADTPEPPQQAEAAVAGVAYVASTIAARHYSTPHPARSASPVQTRQAAASVETSSTAAAVASNPVLQREETDRHLRNSVMELISRELTYPAIARRKGWQGIVRLELHIDADGSITGLHLEETSGYGILDRAAMQCLQFASLPGAARWLQGQTIDIVVPVEYRLVDS
ncbi:MAG: energy transducer TonB [Gammaproteobacteria bacterium]